MGDTLSAVRSALVFGLTVAALMQLGAVGAEVIHPSSTKECAK